METTYGVSEISWSGCLSACWRSWYGGVSLWPICGGVLGALWFAVLVSSLLSTSSSSSRFLSCPCCDSASCTCSLSWGFLWHPDQPRGEGPREGTQEHRRRRQKRCLAVNPVVKTFEVKPMRKVPKSGLRLVGWDGNSGTTLIAGIHANENHISRVTKDGVQHPDTFGSVTQASTVNVGTCDGEEVYVPL